MYIAFSGEVLTPSQINDYLVRSVRPQLESLPGVQQARIFDSTAARRLRPILMTTIATLAGMIPLLIATGPGSESRFAIGLVLGAGMAIGTIFTLLVVPALYIVVAKDRREISTQAE